MLSSPIQTITEELRKFQPATVFVTDRVYFNMTEVIKRARKNYYGYFEKESKDPVSGQDKTWVPMTEWEVESIVKTVDLDTKDILILPREVNDIVSVRMLRPIIDFYLDKLQFPQLLNDMLRVFCIDGTVVVKIFKGYSRGIKKSQIMVKGVDLLNFLIDPAAESIQDADAVIERTLFNLDDFKQYKGVWKNLDLAQKNYNPERYLNQSFANSKSVPKIEVYERWGKGLKSWRLAFENDDWVKPKDFEDEMEDQVIVASAAASQSPSVIHYIAQNTHPKKLKPYEEAWYRRMPNRWHGRGVPEQIFQLQEYVNTIFNIRKNNALVLQNGLFLIRKGSGITPQLLSNMTAGGGIPVTNIDTDIKQLATNDFRASSYKDEETALSMADRVTGARDPLESLSSSSPATIGLIQQQNVRSVFDLIQEGFGLFLKRVIGDHLVDLILDDLDNEEVIRITGSTKQLEDLDELIIDTQVNAEAQKFLDKTGFWPKAEDIEAQREKIRAELKKLGSNRFLKFMRSAFDSEYDLEVHVTSEKMDRAVLAQNLRDMILTWSRHPELSNLDIDTIYQEMANALGIKSDIYRKRNVNQEQQMMMQLQQMLQAQAQGQGQGQEPQRSPRPLQEFPEGAPMGSTMMENANKLPGAGVTR